VAERLIERATSGLPAAGEHCIGGIVEGLLDWRTMIFESLSFDSRNYCDHRRVSFYASKRTGLHGNPFENRIDAVPEITTVQLARSISVARAC